MSELSEKIQLLKKEHKAVVLAHTYQPAEIQDIADYVGDSYGLSVEATATQADIIIFCGVMFMAETAAILNPRKKVIIPEPGAGCPMADMIEADDLRKLKASYPGYQVICYVNSTAEIKALSDICCTSSNALTIVNKLPPQAGIIFVPDKHLGSYINEMTGRQMILWNGFCPTHAKIKPDMITAARAAHPHAIVMIHPEAPHEARVLADKILSTGGMCDFAKASSCTEFIIATESGILHTLRKQNPTKQFYPVTDSTVCPNMKKTTLDKVLQSLMGTGGMEVTVASDIAEKARTALRRMLDMSK